MTRRIRPAKPITPRWYHRVIGVEVLAGAAWLAVRVGTHSAPSAGQLAKNVLGVCASVSLLGAVGVGLVRPTIDRGRRAAGALVVAADGARGRAAAREEVDLNRG